jgi:hypothetical protein
MRLLNYPWFSRTPDVPHIVYTGLDSRTDAIPRELLQTIFVLIIEPAYAEALRYVQTQPVPEQQGNPLRRSQQALNICTRVCRQWYYAGLRLLYQRPVLGSAQQIQLLSRTLTRDNMLTALVQTLWLYDYSIASRSHFPNLLVGGPSRNYHSDLTNMLRICTSLSSIHLSEYHPLPMLDAQSFLAGLSAHFFEYARINGNLRALSISGPYSALLDSTTPNFPSLEVLALRDVLIPLGYCLNARAFPSLRRVSFVRCSRPDIGTPLLSDAGEEQHLSAIEFYYNQFNAIDMAQSISSHADSLQRLVLLGKTELRTMAVLVLPGSPVQLRLNDRLLGTQYGVGPVSFPVLQQMSIGIFALPEARSYDTTLGKWHLPRSLLQLTLIRQRWSLRADVDTDLDVITGALEQALKERSDSPPLAVVVEGLVPPGARSELAAFSRMREVIYKNLASFEMSGRSVADYISAQLLYQI